MENAGSEVLGVIANDSFGKFGDKVFQVNITGKTIKEVTENILDILDSNYISEDIDWLEMITKRNDLKKFFAY